MVIDYIWFFLFIIFTTGMFILLPEKNIKKLLLFGIIAGGVVSTIVQYTAISLDLWNFNVGLIIIKKIPLFINLMWIPPVIVFAYLINNSEHTYQYLYIIFLFASLTTITTYGSVLLNLRDYLNWNIYYDFLLALTLHSFYTIYLYFTNQKNPVKS